MDSRKNIEVNVTKKSKRWSNSVETRSIYFCFPSVSIPQAVWLICLKWALCSAVDATAFGNGWSSKLNWKKISGRSFSMDCYHGEYWVAFQLCGKVCGIVSSKVRETLHHPSAATKSTQPLSGRALSSALFKVFRINFSNHGLAKQVTREHKRLYTSPQLILRLCTMVRRPAPRAFSYRT